MQSITPPKHHIVINALKVPKKITVFKFSENELRGKSVSVKPIGEISSPEDIKKITKELDAINIENITSIDLINYQRMRSDNYPYYFMTFDYDNIDGLSTKLENGYIQELIVTSNRNVAIEELISKEGLALFNKYYYDIYPVGLSKDTEDMIFSYLK
jgi:hypothetical protein